MALLMRPSYYSPLHRRSIFDPMFPDPYSVIDDVERRLSSIVDPEPYFFRDMERPLSYMRDLERDITSRFEAIEKELGGRVQVTAEPKDGKFALKCNMTGFNHDEVKCDLEGDDLVLTAEHKDDNSYRKFHQRIWLPESVDKNSLKCEWDSEKGEISIEALATPPAIENKENKAIESKNSE